MTDPAETLEEGVEDRARGATVEVGDEADSAGVALGGRIVEEPRGGDVDDLRAGTVDELRLRAAKPVEAEGRRLARTGPRAAALDRLRFVRAGHGGG
jgi:hypothetical protein